MASQAGLVAALLRHELIGSVAVSTYYPHHYPSNDRLHPVAPPPLRGYATTRTERRLLQDHKLVAWGGGVDLEDRGSKAKLLLLTLRLALLKAGGSALSQTFQGAGPLTTRSGSLLAGASASLFDYAIPREPAAARFMSTLPRLPHQITLGCDAALLLDRPSRGYGEQVLSSAGIDPHAPTLGFNLRRWYHQVGGWLPTGMRRRKAGRVSRTPMHNLLDSSRFALEEMTKLGYKQLVLIPMYRHEPEPWEDDIALLEEAIQGLDSLHCVRLYDDISPQRLLSVVSCLDLMLGVRLHSTLLAHVAGVPAVHIAYAKKGWEYFHEVDQTRRVVSIDQVVGSTGADLLARALHDAHINRQDARCLIATQVARLRGRGEAALDSLIRWAAGGTG